MKLECHRKRTEIKFEIIQGEEMSPERVQFIARLLMKWWKEDYEKETDDGNETAYRRE